MDCFVAGDFWCIDSSPIYFSHVSWSWAGVISFFLHRGRWIFWFVSSVSYMRDNRCSYLVSEQGSHGLVKLGFYDPGTMLCVGQT